MQHIILDYYITVTLSSPCFRMGYPGLVFHEIDSTNVQRLKGPLNVEKIECKALLSGEPGKMKINQ